jgi:ligand-binding sensor domain-containing protein/signal transduction histidine kinase
MSRWSLKDSNFFLDRRTRTGCLLVCLAAFAVPAGALDPQRAMSQYVYERWGSEQGFPRGPVYAIAQSSDGYLWIGAQGGLVRFDGVNFRLVRQEPALPSGESILGLTPDREGNLWIRLEGATMVRYRDGVFERFPPLENWPGSQITATTQSSQGELLGAVMERGTTVYRRNKFEMISDASGLPRSPVLSIVQTSEGSIWLGTRGAGLFRMQHGQTLSITKGLPDEKINCLLPGEGGALWIGTDSGIARWDGHGLTTDGVPASLTRLQVLALLKDRDANLWVGTDSGGLLRLNHGAVFSLDQGEGRARQAVTALFEDREGNLWIGSDSGIERLRDSAFETYSVSEGLPAEGGGPVYVDSENRIWFPPLQGGLWVKDGREGRAITAAGLEHDVIYAMYGRKGELWLGRRRGGLTVLRPAGASFAANSFTHADGLAQDSVYSVYPARDGTVWAGTLSAGVSALRDGRFTNYTIADGLASNTVAAILETADGILWFATPRGLSMFSNGRWRTYTSKDGLPSDNVNCLLEDSNVLWAGTASGLAFRRGEGFQSRAEWPAALREQVFGLAEDRFGGLWVATSQHVLRVNRDALARGNLAGGDLRAYGLGDGLRGLEGVKRQRSVVTDPAGRVWFSLNRGISFVDPARLTRNVAPAIPHIQSLQADGEEIPLAMGTRVPGGRRRIAFSFAGLSLSAPEQVRFRYWLEGFDHGWSDPSTTREAVYTNLTPGPYRLRVVASNPEGVWNSSESIFAFDVEPLLWQAWWFRAACVAAAIAVMIGLYRARLGRLTRQLNLRSEERLAERTRIAQELHDTLLQGFLSTSMQVHVAADRLPEDSAAKPILNRSLQLMRQVIEEGRNAVRGLRSSRSESLDLEQAFALVQQEVAIGPSSGPPAEFRVIVVGEQRPLHPLLRDEVYRIGREALINALRHAQAHNIEIELRYLPRHFRVVVRDDGRGVDSEILNSGRDGHWGLPGMQEKAAQVGARLKVWSRIAGGTEVELSVPGYIAFRDYPKHWYTWLGRPFHRWGRNSPKPEMRQEDERTNTRPGAQR